MFCALRYSEALQPPKLLRVYMCVDRPVAGMTVACSDTSKKAYVQAVHADGSVMLKDVDAATTWHVQKPLQTLRVKCSFSASPMRDVVHMLWQLSARFDPTTGQLVAPPEGDYSVKDRLYLLGRRSCCNDLLHMYRIVAATVGMQSDVAEVDDYNGAGLCEFRLPVLHVALCLEENTVCRAEPFWVPVYFLLSWNVAVLIRQT